MIRPSMSSREKPRPVCVRSFVPKEKKSACAAIAPAVRHARGSSIIVPILTPSAPSSAATRSTSERAIVELARVGDERDHHLDRRGVAGALAHRSRGAEDRARLHLVDLRVQEAEAHAAGAQHRVALVERAHPLEHVLELGDLAVAARPAPRPGARRRASRSGRNSCSGGSSRRMVTGRPSIASKHPLEVGLLHRQQLVERGPAARLVVGHDHRLHLRLAVGGHEHVLGAAEADALGAERARTARVLGRVGVRAHAERAQLVAPAEDGLEVRVDLRRHERDVAGGDGAGAAVDGDQVALVQDELADVDHAGVEVDVDRRRRRSPRAGPCRAPRARRARPCRPPR